MFTREKNCRYLIHNIWFGHGAHFNTNDDFTNKNLTRIKINERIITADGTRIRPKQNCQKRRRNGYCSERCMIIIITFSWEGSSPRRSQRNAKYTSLLESTFIKSSFSYGRRCGPYIIYIHTYSSPQDKRRVIVTGVVLYGSSRPRRDIVFFFLSGL